MGHFAKVTDGKVVNVIVAEKEFFDSFVDDSAGEWIKTSYNMRGGVYHDPETGLPADDQSVISDDEGRMRKNYAGIGYTYDRVRDAFIPPNPFPSWVLNEDSCLWEPPVPVPDTENRYYWDEESTNWVLVD